MTFFDDLRYGAFRVCGELPTMRPDRTTPCRKLTYLIQISSPCRSAKACGRCFRVDLAMIYPSTVVLAGKHRLNEGIDYNFEGYKMAGREIVGVGNLDSSASGNSVASSPHSHEKIPWYIGGEIQKFVVHRLTTFFSFGGEIHKFPWFIILLYLGMAMVQVRGGFLGTQTRPVVGRVQVRKAASIESSDELRVNLQLRSRPQNPSSPPE